MAVDTCTLRTLDIYPFKNIYLGNSLVVQWLGLCSSKGMIPEWGTKILQAV